MKKKKQNRIKIKNERIRKAGTKMTMMTLKMNKRR